MAAQCRRDNLSHAVRAAVVAPTTLVENSSVVTFSFLSFGSATKNRTRQTVVFA